jgi:ATP-dependent RNA helicase DDX18/HAS1
VPGACVRVLRIGCLAARFTVRFAVHALGMGAAGLGASRTRDGFRSYLQAYASHSMKDVFNVHELDIAAVAKSFGFSAPPRICLDVLERAKKIRRRGGGGGFGDEWKNRDRLKDLIRKRLASGQRFRASNPHGKRDEQDRRQFVA